MRKFAGLVVGLVMFAGLASAQTTITYWQYSLANKVEAMDRLIEIFEEQNPDIRVIHEHSAAYDTYIVQAPVALSAGEGPDVVQLFYGWIPAWAAAGYIEPLPESHFDTAELDAGFAPLAAAAKLNGQYYGMPGGVRSLALFYNADMLAEVGYDAPPATWDELIEIAQALNIEQGGRYTRIGFGVAPSGQDHHLLRSVLTRQFGTEPYNEDYTLVTYDNDAGLAAFEFYTSLITEHRVGVVDFVPGASGYRDGFRLQENIGMIVDGSFAIAAIAGAAEFNWGVAELPLLEEGGVQANFASFWVNGLAPRAVRDPAVLDASARFLHFLNSDEAQLIWMEMVGELPASRELIGNPELASDPVYGPFVRAFEYATAEVFYDELGQRDNIVNAINEVTLTGADPRIAWSRAALNDQAVLDAAPR